MVLILPGELSGMLPPYLCSTIAKHSSRQWLGLGLVTVTLIDPTLLGIERED